jgi:hypothetical protein
LCQGSSPSLEIIAMVYNLILSNDLLIGSLG